MNATTCARPALLVLAFLPAVVGGTDGEATLTPRYDVEGKWGFVDEDGQFKIEPQFDRAGPFGGGLAPVRVDNKYGYIDAAGQTVIPFRFDLADTHREGFAAVKVAEKYGYIDTRGEFVIPPRFEWAGAFHDGRAVAQVDGSFGYIGRDGKFVIEPKYDRAAPFSEGLAAVSIRAAPLGFIDTQGKVVVEPKYDWAIAFHEGLAAAGRDERVEVLDFNGLPRLVTEFKTIGRFQHGLAPVASDGKWGIINARGTEVVESRFDAISITGPGTVRALMGDALFTGHQDATGEFKLTQEQANTYFEKVKLQSVPAGAIVYKPSLWDFEHAAGVEQLLVPEYRVNTGPTEAEDYLELGQVYRLIFVLGDRHEFAQCIPDVENRVVVTFP